jgi:hypothetical protein
MLNCRVSPWAPLGFKDISWLAHQADILKITKSPGTPSSMTYYSYSFHYLSFSIPAVKSVSLPSIHLAKINQQMLQAFGLKCVKVFSNVLLFLSRDFYLSISMVEQCGGLAGL